MRRIHDPDGWTRHSARIVGLLVLAALALLVFVALIGVLSTFRSGLDEPPLYWWGLTSGFAVLPMLFILGWSLVLFWLIPRSGNPKLIAKWSLVAVPIILIVCILHDVRSGVALYHSSLTYRQPGFLSPKHSVPYASLEAVATSCVFRRERRSYGRGAFYASMTYEVRTPNGDWINLSDTALRLSDRRDWRGWLAVVSKVDQAVTNAGGERRVRRHAMDGRLLYEEGCVEAFGRKFDEAGRLQWYRAMRLDGISKPGR